MMKDQYMTSNRAVYSELFLDIWDNDGLGDNNGDGDGDVKRSGSGGSVYIPDFETYPVVTDRLKNLITIMAEICQYSAKVPATPKGKKVAGWSPPAAAMKARKHEAITGVTKAQGISIGLCAAYVKIGLYAAGFSRGYIELAHAKDANPKLKAEGFTSVYSGGMLT